MRILLIGDVVGKAGLDALLATLPELVIEHEPDFIIANGENVAGGKGISIDAARRMLDAGINVITLGNHAWQRSEILTFIDREPRLLRPANFPHGSPGRGHGVYTASNGARVGVANLLGRALMDPSDDPFRAGETILEEFRAQGVHVICFDYHGEATSEKRAFAEFVDGRATVVVGTHTHVQTADEQVLRRGAAFITDLGMTGPQNSVIGVSIEPIIERFRTGRPQRYDVAEGPCVLCGVSVTINRETGKASAIKRIQIRDIGMN